MNHEVQCPRCQHEFSTDDEPVCECPKCGTSIPVEGQDDKEFTQTTIFEA